MAANAKRIEAMKLARITSKVTPGVMVETERQVRPATHFCAGGRKSYFASPTPTSLQSSRKIREARVSHSKGEAFMVEAQDRMTVRQAAELIGRDRSTVLRWATHGCRGIVLRAEWLGGVLITTRAWVEDFLEALNRDREKSRQRRQLAGAGAA
jgi:hypothetical protein